MAGKRADGGASGTRRARRSSKDAGRSPWRRRLRRLVVWTSVTALVLALVGVAGFVFLYKTIDIPDPNAEALTETTFVYYDGGKTELGRFDVQNRTSLPLDEIPENLQHAVVAAENKSFYTDQGIDPKGILRAAFTNASGGSTQGASTITQQYVKNLYLTQERSYKRKIKEAILSLKVQRTLSKNEVLEGYLNTIYFGRGAYGVEAASESFFDKKASQLNLRESVALSSILNNPTRFDPENGRDSRIALKERMSYTLDNMVDLDYLSADQAAKAARRIPTFPEIKAESAYGGQRGHMLTMVRDELEQLGFSEADIDGGGLRVTTTFTQQDMQAAEQGVLEARPEGFGDKQLHIGVASVEPGTGAVRGFYAGQDYLTSQLNWAVAGGQAGSTFKAFALAAALKEGYSLQDTFEGNSPLVLDDGTEVENEGDSDEGSAISLLTATTKSVNTAYVDLTRRMPDGPDEIVKTAEQMGIPPERAKRSKDIAGFPDRTPGLRPETTVSLGSATVSPINMANAYATIANGGVAAEPFVIEKVVDSRSGKTVYDHKVSTQRAMSADVASDVSYALQQNVDSGTATGAQALGRDAAGKTGTATNGLGEVSSAWFAGYTPQLSTAVMYVRGKGNEQLKGWLPSYFGGAYPTDTWAAVMERALEGVPDDVEFPEPAFVDGDVESDDTTTYTPPPPATTTQAPPPAPTKTPQGPTSAPSTSEPPTSEPPTSEPPTSEPPTSQPPTSQPPTSSPPTLIPPAGGGGGDGDPGETGDRRALAGRR